MKHHIFTIFDSKAEAYLPPFFLHQKAMAVRAFTDSVNNPESAISLHPGDYTLFHIGEFDDSNAQITLATSTSMGNGVEFIKPASKETQLELIEETA